jgi:hypothetical protein
LNKYQEFQKEGSKRSGREIVLRNNIVRTVCQVKTLQISRR